MEEAELEKIVRPIFELVDPAAGERLFHCSYRNSEEKILKIPLPWFCAKDVDALRKFTKNPYYFYRCTHHGIVAEHVVTPMFYAMTQHDKQCTDPISCNHTLNFIVDFLFKSRDEMDKTIAFMFAENLYNDLLQFYFDEEQKEDMYDVISEPSVVLNDNGFFAVRNEPIFYRLRKFSGLLRLSAPALEVLSKIEELFGEDIERGNPTKLWSFSGLLKKALEQDYSQKKA